MTDIPTLETVLSQVSEGERAALTTALLAREDQIADFIRLCATQFGAMPQFTAEVLAVSTLGTPPSEEERRLIREGYEGIINQMFAQYRAQTGLEPGPIPEPGQLPESPDNL